MGALLAAVAGAAGVTGVVTNYQTLLDSVPVMEPPAWLIRCGVVMFAATLAAGIVGGFLNCFAMTNWRRPPLIARKFEGQTYTTVGLLPNLLIGALGAWMTVWVSACPGSDDTAKTAAPETKVEPIPAPPPDNAKAPQTNDLVPKSTKPVPFRYPQAFLALFAAGAAGFTASRALASHGRALLLWEAVERALRLPSDSALANQVPNMRRASEILTKVTEATRQSPPTERDPRRRKDKAAAVG